MCRLHSGQYPPGLTACHDGLVMTTAPACRTLHPARTAPKRRAPMAQTQSNFTDADIQSLESKLNGVQLTQGESAAMAAMVGGELSQASDVEPYIRVSTPL